MISWFCSLGPTAHCCFSKTTCPLTWSTSVCTKIGLSLPTRSVAVSMVAMYRQLAAVFRMGEGTAAPLALAKSSFVGSTASSWQDIRRTEGATMPSGWRMRAHCTAVGSKKTAAIQLSLDTLVSGSGIDGQPCSSRLSGQSWMPSQCREVAMHRVPLQGKPPTPKQGSPPWTVPFSLTLVSVSDRLRKSSQAAVVTFRSKRSPKMSSSPPFAQSCQPSQRQTPPAQMTQTPGSHSNSASEHSSGSSYTTAVKGVPSTA
mmetsp:Transcript_89473/g.213775  ORF Transcript_89473/g.213775 Transcript_89473/m.213775 type:complete len:258 (-) Transcript_89473:218-991(-)